MTHSLQILSEAADDIKEITLWYKGIPPELGRRFVAELYNSFGRMVANPNACFNMYKSCYIREGSRRNPSKRNRHTASGNSPSPHAIIRSLLS